MGVKEFPDETLAVRVDGAGEAESGEYFEPAGDGEEFYDRRESSKVWGESWGVEGYD